MLFLRIFTIFPWMPRIAKAVEFRQATKAAANKTIL